MPDNKISDGENFLFVNGSRESELSQEYLNRSGVSHHIRLSGSATPSELLPPGSIFGSLEATPLFSNSFREPIIPSLIVRNPIYLGLFSYLSFSGVKSFLRDKVRGKLNGEGKFYWTDVKTFYPHQEYNKEKGFGKKRKLVTCFDKEQKRIFEGPLDESPHKLKELLDSHDYKDWYKVSSWQIGDLEELARRQDGRGIVLDEETRTVLFPDEIDMLREGKRVVTQDSRSIYHVTFESYFVDNGQIFGLYAHMFD